MRNNILCFATAALLMMTGAAQAITYNVNRTIDAGSVTGFIETDGTLGILSTANITDWVLTLTAPNLAGGPSDVISYATQAGTSVVGNGTTATATQILFDFGGSSSFFAIQGGSSNYWCLEISNSCTGRGDGEHMGFDTTGSILAQTTSHQGQVVIASVSAIPLPLGLPLFAGGLGLLSVMGWHRKRKRERNITASA